MTTADEVLKKMVLESLTNAVRSVESRIETYKENISEFKNREYCDSNTVFGFTERLKTFQNQLTGTINELTEVYVRLGVLRYSLETEESKGGE